MATPWWPCDVGDREAVEAAVDGAATRLGGLDVVVANAGVAAQLPLVGGDPVFETTLRVNTAGVCYTLRAAGPIGHPQGPARWPSPRSPRPCTPAARRLQRRRRPSEALGSTLRAELRHTGARVRWPTSPSWTPT